jgi:hypothetical protein
MYLTSVQGDPAVVGVHQQPAGFVDAGGDPL